MAIGIHHAQIALDHLENEANVAVFSSLAYPIVKEFIEIKDQNDKLQKRNTELVEENRKLKANLEAVPEKENQ